ncbi:MAG: glycosyltransferase [Candidatus Magasanikbacteria bacterium]|nr:glycosyltransferase [Candidatus Magasanikbacteria bacterium]
MKLLIITQIVDVTDSDLGFFHNWIKKIAARVDQLYVICLQKGKTDLPNNVTVLSLGKEQGVSTFTYLRRFYGYVWRLRKEYDGVFVHMNPEYVVLAGWLWRWWHKKVGLWYVHKSVTPALRVAEKLVTKIFTTSAESFRLPSKKVQWVGHGIDVREFEKVPEITTSSELQLLSIGRISVSKNHKTIIEAVAKLKKEQPERAVSLAIVGAAITPTDQKYLAILQDLVKELHLEREVTFVGGVDRKVLVTYLTHSTMFVHASETGSMDKVVLEALAANRVVISSSSAYSEAVGLGLIVPFTSGDVHDLACKIASTPIHTNHKGFIYIKEKHNLDTLIEKIITYFV